MENVRHFVQSYQHLHGDALISEVYRRHPYFAINSRIIERILPSQSAREAIEFERPKRHKGGLVTIGYEGKSLEAYLNQLIKNSVTLLCDVRNNPLSRKYGFSKKTLKHACENVGIRYEHLPKLGIISEKRRTLKTTADYEALFVEYEREVLPEQTTELAKIDDWMIDGHRVSLTCYEALSCDCHRHCIAEFLDNRSGQTLSLTHL
jgi:uncharacterized protein (DUF488 family)